MLTLFLMPFIGRWKLGHRFNVVWTFALLIGAGVLTALAWRDDHNGTTPESQHYLAAVADAEAQAERAVELAGSPTGIPPTGALSMLRSDPKTQGPKLFRQHCAACHSHAPEGQANGRCRRRSIVAEKPTRIESLGLRQLRLGARHSRSRKSCRPTLLRQHGVQRRRDGQVRQGNDRRQTRRTQRRRAGQVSSVRSRTWRWRWRQKRGRPLGKSPIWRNASRPDARPWSMCSPASIATSSATTATWDGARSDGLRLARMAHRVPQQPGR